MKDIKRRLELTEEAIKDWRKGELSDLSALVAIGLCINDNDHLSEEAMQWGINALKVTKGE